MANNEDWGMFWGGIIVGGVVGWAMSSYEVPKPMELEEEAASSKRIGPDRSRGVLIVRSVITPTGERYFMVKPEHYLFSRHVGIIDGYYHEKDDGKLLVKANGKTPWKASDFTLSGQGNTRPIHGHGGALMGWQHFQPVLQGGVLMGYQGVVLDGFGNLMGYQPFQPAM